MANMLVGTIAVQRWTAMGTAENYKHLYEQMKKMFKQLNSKGAKRRFGKKMPGMMPPGFPGM